ncbi:MAG: nucleotide pyrophosphohydrolase [Candidatus Thorarchaeota archaeon]
MGESQPTLDELIDLIRQFVHERDWEQYNKPAALAVSASIEMGELLELFQWKTDEDVEAALQDDDFVSMLSGEIADVLVYILRICDRAGIDPTEIIVQKMKKNAKKYPVSEWKGKAPSKLNRSE